MDKQKFYYTMLDSKYCVAAMVAGTFSSLSLRHYRLILFLATNVEVSDSWENDGTASNRKRKHLNHTNVKKFKAPKINL